MNPNDDPTTLTPEKLTQAALSFYLGFRVQRRKLEYAENDKTYRCLCSGPATLFNIEIVYTTGKFLFLCDTCAENLLLRASGEQQKP